MAKISGKGCRLLIDGYNLSGDTNAINSLGGGPALLEVSGLDVEGHERIGGTISASLEVLSIFNPSTNAAHDRFADLPAAAVHSMFLTAGDEATPARGDEGVALIGRQTTYPGQRDPNGLLSFTTMFESDGYGVQWGVILTDGIETQTGATNGASVDHGSATSFGLSAYLQVTAFTGTSITVAIEDSTDDAVWNSITGASFTAATGIGVERIATGATENIDRYLRVATTGTFTSATITVVVDRHLTAVSL